jgi:hypothetical protein
LASESAKGVGSSVQAVLGRLVRQGLHTREAAKDIYRRWKSEPKVDHEDATQLVRWLISQRYLTPEQAAMFAAPKAPPEAEKRPAEEWDVELVKALPMQEIAISLGRLKLSRRDLLMLGIGAATVTAAGLVSMAVGSRF